MDSEFSSKLNEYEKEIYKLIKEKQNSNNLSALSVDFEDSKGIISVLNNLIDFNMFQYEPYYKLYMQEKYPKKLYITDEVGSGKTIEVGIILTELLYNKEFNTRTDKALIICPNLLTRKWQVILKSLFGIASVIVTKTQEMHNGINIISFDSVSRDEIKDAGKNIKCLIVDEAHNASGKRYKKIENIREKLKDDGYVILLSATPLAGKEDGVDINKQIYLLFAKNEYNGDIDNLFKEQDNPYICKNRKIEMRYAKNPYNYKVETEIKNHYCENTLLNDFLEDDYLKEIFCKKEITKYMWISILGSSPASAMAYIEKLINADKSEMIDKLNELHMDYNGEEDDEGSSDNEDLYADVDFFYEYDNIIAQLEVYNERAKEIIEGLNDDKLNKLYDIILKNFTSTKDDEGVFFNHILVFTNKKTTAKYIEENIKKYIEKYELDYKLKIPCEVFRVDGDLNENEKIKRIKQYESVKDKMSILVITNVACEGQDMDYGNTIVNYDMDYSPVRLEQRRGRVDRFEVKKKKIYVHNLFAEGIDNSKDESIKKYSIEERLRKKVDDIHEKTGTFFEIIEKNPNGIEDISEEELKQRKEKIFTHFRDLADLTQDYKAEEMDVINEQAIKKALKRYGDYKNIYDLINAKLDGDVTIEERKNDKENYNEITVTTGKRNIDFWKYILNGGTVISHIIEGE